MENGQAKDNIAPNMLASLLSNPELIERVRGIMQSSTSTAKGEEEQETAVTSVSSARPISADGIPSLLSNPELMAKLPQLFAAMKPMLSAERSQEKKDLSPEEKRTALLLAIKPYLSPERRQAVDTVLMIARLGSILKQLT